MTIIQQVIKETIDRYKQPANIILTLSGVLIWIVVGMLLQAKLYQQPQAHAIADQFIQSNPEFARCLCNDISNQNAYCKFGTYDTMKWNITNDTPTQV